MINKECKIGMNQVRMQNLPYSDSGVQHTHK